MQNAITKSKIVNLYGKAGVGKTFFIRSFINQMMAVDKYRDGVYLFELEQYAKQNPHGNIKDLMR